MSNQLNLNSVSELEDLPFEDIKRFEFARYDLSRYTTVLLHRVSYLEDKFAGLFGTPCVVFGTGELDRNGDLVCDHCAEFHIVTDNGVLTLYGEPHNVFAQGNDRG